MNNTNISWTDYTWNPVTGCTPMSDGCRYCYARTFAERMRGTKAFPNGLDLTGHPERLTEPLCVQKPSKIFVCSMSDLFLPEIGDQFRDRVFAIIEAAPQHTFQVLTKRVEEAARYTCRRPLPRNVWLGVTVEDDLYGWRADMLCLIDASTRFVSAEPLLGDIIFDRKTLNDIDWLIVGGESGQHLHDLRTRRLRGLVDKVDGVWQPTNDGLDRVRLLRDQCAHPALYFKQWGGPTPMAAGRELDGRTWEEMP